LPEFQRSVRVAQAAARAALAKKGHDVVALDMAHAVTYTDLFILVTGNTTRQTHAIAEGVQRSLRETGVRPARVEGERAGEWILIDYLDVIVHVFTPDSRSFYRLEQLWGVPQLQLDDESVEREWSFEDEECLDPEAEVESA
jgi:ribosome-associated protein